MGDSSELKSEIVTQITRLMSAHLTSGTAGLKCDGSATTSGLERAARWKSSGDNGEGREKEGDPGDKESAGIQGTGKQWFESERASRSVFNWLIALTIGDGTQSDSSAVKMRTTVYRGMDASILKYQPASGGISHFHPLRQGSWVVVCKMDQLFLGRVSVIYVKGGGQRPTHNYSDSCEDISKLSRLVVLTYTTWGDTVLSPLTVSAPRGTTPDTATYLYLHPENLVASLDVPCPKPVESSIDLEPGLSMHTVNRKLIAAFRELEVHAPAICRTVDKLFKEMRKRRKRADEDADEVDGLVNGESAAAQSKRLRE
ncbi:hypothetical protein C8Q73DRAFT_675529 [Cubamyces lactineus]|nr:hypothetical protein C8Q73DRAFT_675529 [Cubamyces lactineus]